ncbi:DUF6612 family protein [Halovenus halobia]|uniref:DUF6612 family protein n=1 Tax=Halovenus halobia TaxID=3396622 RepID=UPI003F569646
MESVETVRITQEMTMNLGGEPFTVQSEGAMDIEAEKARFTTTSSLAGSNFEQEQYLVGETMYLRSEMFDGWVKQNISGFGAWQNNQFAQQERLLGNASLEVTGQQTVDGNEVYVTELDIGGETLESLFNEQAGNLSSQLASDVSFEKASVTQHIDVETNRVRYTKLQYSLTAQGQELSFTLEQRFSKFNEPVGIELPEEAQSADPIEESYGQ